MPPLDVTADLDDDDVAAVSALLKRAAAVDGHRGVGDDRWLDLVVGDRRTTMGFVARGDDGQTLAYAQATREPGAWSIDVVVDPVARTDGLPAGERVLTSALDAVREAGGGHVHWWVTDPGPLQTALAEQTGLHAGRELLQLRRPLPVGEPVTVEVRPFRPGADDEEWLAVNNRAFDWHPEQGNWDLALLQARQAEPWFEPDGFLLHHDAETGRLAGFCWTKVHTDERPPLGEIYVIGVDPDFGGRGLGRALSVAGLDSLHRRGLDIGMLYVDASNAPGRRMYDSLGFSPHHTDVAFVADV